MSFVASAGREVVSRCYVAAEAARWDLAIDVFSAALETSAARAFAGKTPAAAEVARYLESLHLADLALACACASGHESAWTHFVAAHQPGLRRAADAMAPSGGAREIADGLYGELFGLRQAGGARQSLFRYFHGRSTLSTWLRTVLAQRLVDRQRSYRRLEPLPDEESAEGPLAAPAGDAPPERPRWLAAVRPALARAFECLAPRDRLRVTLYHADGLTLAEIGRALGEHEATVSRHLTRTRREVREAVEAELARLGFDERARREAVQSLVNDPGPIDVADLVGHPPARKIAPADRSTKWGPGSV